MNETAVKRGRTEIMPAEIDTKLLADLLKERRDREDLSLREVGQEIGVSAPTLQRVEAGLKAGQIPTTSVLMKLCNWIGVSIDELRPGHSSIRRATPDQIEVYLRADPKLDKKAASAITNIVREVYASFTKGKK